MTTPPDPTLKMKSLVTTQQRIIKELEIKLRIERRKTMDLQKQIHDLRKQVLDLQKHVHVKQGGV